MAVTLGPKTNISSTPDTLTARGALVNMYDFVNEMMQAAEIDITCAATLDIGGKDSARLRIVGTPVAITSLGTKYRGPIILRASNNYLFVYNSVSLGLPGGKSLAVKAGDVLLASPKSTLSGTSDGWVVTVLSRGDGGAWFNSPISIIGGWPIALGGQTENGFWNYMKVTQPTANRSLYIPDADVDLALLRDSTTTRTGLGRVATWAEAQAGIMGGNVFLNPEAAFNWARIFADDGFMKFPGTPGLIIQWGIVPINGDISGEVYISKLFPTSFNYQVGAVVGVADGDHDSYVMWRRSATTLNTVAFTVRETTGAVQSGTWGVTYIAIGW